MNEHEAQNEHEALIQEAARTVRDYADLDRAIGEVLFNVNNYPKAVQARMLGENTRPLTEKLVDAVLAAGYRKRPESEWEYGTALRASSGNLWDFEVDSKQHAYAHVAECDAADHTPGESCVVVRRLVTYGPWEQVNP